MKKTLILGASSNPERYSYRAAKRLLAHGHEIELIGKRPEAVFGRTIETGKKIFEDIDTVTLYLSPRNQKEYHEYILLLKPKRVIFNPGTENPELEELLKRNNIRVDKACTLVLLNTGDY
ncbi:MAG: CoA-binding protein [Bacteroidota bacterium]|nr:CoA-binding protein [Bacteroidota bacterium]